MNVGDYVRTKYGKIINIQVLQIIKDINCDYVEINYEKILRNNIVKSSPKIIDLIQVGDYVNGMKVINRCGTLMMADTFDLVEDEDIRTILTKEQFEAMKYEIK